MQAKIMFLTNKLFLKAKYIFSCDIKANQLDKPVLKNWRPFRIRKNIKIFFRILFKGEYSFPAVSQILWQSAN